MCSTKIPYDDDWITVDVPASATLRIVDLNQVGGVADETAEIERALDNPVGHGGLETLAKGKRTVVVIDDNTRPTPVNKILPVLLDRLNHAGIEDRDIEVLVAQGTHRQMSDGELRKKIGETQRRISVRKHYWREKDMLVDLGKTPSGVPLSVNRAFLDSSIRIGIGHIAPHCQAGWTGGAKIVQPGVCGAETTDYTHWMSAKFDVRELLGIADNPVRLEIEDTVRNIGLDFIVNTVLNRKEQIVKAVAGDFVKAHRQGVEAAKEIYRASIPSKADIVIADSNPPTYSIDLWQASKAIIASYLAVKPGGTIIVFAPCREGVSPEHPELAKFGHRPYEEVKSLVESGAMNDLNAASASAQIGQVLADNVTIDLYSRISRAETERLGFEYVENPQTAINRALERHGADSKILVLRNGSEILPTTT